MNKGHRVNEGSVDEKHDGFRSGRGYVDQMNLHFETIGQKSAREAPESVCSLYGLGIDIL